jgi:hypothetical protein
MPSWPRSRARMPGGSPLPLLMRVNARPPQPRERSPAHHLTTDPGAEGGGGWPMHATAQPWHAEGRPSPTGRTTETAGGQTLDNSARQSLGCPGFNFQILLVPRGLGEGLPRAEEYLACVKRTPFTEQPSPLRLTSAGSNLRLLTAGEKAKTFSQTFSHPSLSAYETHRSARSSAEQSRSFPS